MRAFITGASGFVGGHLIQHLRECGDQIYAPGLDDFNIRDAGQVRDRIADFKPDVLYHLAGIAFVPECESNFMSALEINVNGTENVLKGLRQASPDAACVLISSGEVYGKVDPEKLPSVESDELNPQNNYSLTKVFAEQLGIRAIKAFGQRVVIMRPFNHIGPAQSNRFAVASFAEQLAAMKAGRRAALMKVGNLTAKRDFTDVRDIVKGYRLAAQKGQGIYNLCSSRPHSIQSILDKLVEISGIDVRIELDSERLRASDNPETRGSFEKAQKDLGWQPTISIEQSLKDCLQWFDSQSAKQIV